MKIPGLTFIVVPILLFIAYININIFVNAYRNIEKDPEPFLGITAIIYILGFFVELFFFHTDSETMEEWGSKSLFISPIRVTYKVLKFINDKLTITI